MSKTDLPRSIEIPSLPGWSFTIDGEVVKTSNGRVKKQRPAGTGAMQVDIGKTTQMVHRLGAYAYFGKPLYGGYRVVWRNGDMTDNRPENLMFSGKDPGRLTCLCGHGPQKPTHGRDDTPCKACVRCDLLPHEHKSATHSYAPCPCQTWRELWGWRDEERIDKRIDGVV